MEREKNIRCNVCGGNDIEFLPHSRIGRCKSCGALLMLPDFEDQEILALLNQAYIQRTSSKFDEAISTYNFIIEKNPNEVSAYEGLLLSKYGIVYERDEEKNINVPTCRRYNPVDVFEDESYRSYLSYCKSEEEKEVFHRQAEQISSLQKDIAYQLRNEKDYDVFISFKAKDENGKTSKDAEIARNLYDTLSEKGLRVFMSEVTLKNRISEEFEPIIYRALHSAKHFILVGTSKANIESSWVRNEWSRFIDRIKDSTDDVTLNSFICVYDGMDPNLFPRVNHKSIQCVDASDLSYRFNICDYICRSGKVKNNQAPIFGESGNEQLLDVEEISSRRAKENYFNDNDPIKSARKSKALGFTVPAVFAFVYILAYFIGAFIHSYKFFGSLLSTLICVALFVLEVLFIVLFGLTLKSDDYYLHLTKDKVLHISLGRFSNKMSIGSKMFYSGKDKIIEFQCGENSYKVEIKKKKISLYSLGE